MLRKNEFTEEGDPLGHFVIGLTYGSPYRDQWRIQQLGAWVRWLAAASLGDMRDECYAAWLKPSPSDRDVASVAGSSGAVSAHVANLRAAERHWVAPPMPPSDDEVEEAFKVRGVKLGPMSALLLGGDWNCVLQIKDRRYSEFPHRRASAVHPNMLKAFGVLMEGFLGLRDLGQETMAHNYMSKDASRSARNTRLLLRGGDIDEQMGALEARTMHERHRKGYDHAPALYSIGILAPRSEVPHYPRHLRFHRELEARIRGWCKSLCAERLQCAFFNRDAEATLGGMEPLAPAPVAWYTQEEDVVSEDAQRQPEQLVYIVREACWRAAEDLKKAAPQLAASPQAKYHVCVALWQELFGSRVATRGKVKRVDKLMKAYPRVKEYVVERLFVGKTKSSMGLQYVVDMPSLREHMRELTIQMRGWTESDDGYLRETPGVDPLHPGVLSEEWMAWEERAWEQQPSRAPGPVSQAKELKRRMRLPRGEVKVMKRREAKGGGRRPAPRRIWRKRPSFTGSRGGSGRKGLLSKKFGIW